MKFTGKQTVPQKTGVDGNGVHVLVLIVAAWSAINPQETLVLQDSQIQQLEAVTDPDLLCVLLAQQEPRMQDKGDALIIQEN